MTTIDNWILKSFLIQLKKIELFKKLSLKTECKRKTNKNIMPL